MKSGLPGALFHRQTRWHSLKSVFIVIGTLGLLAFYPLTGCASSPNRVFTQTDPVTPVATTLATSIETSQSPTPTQQTSPWKVTWSDEFNGPAGTTPDPSKWSPRIGGSGSGNQQLEYTTDNQNAYMDGQGHMVLEARRDTSGELKCWYGTCRYTSASISTQGHFTFMYGKIEARIKIPYGQGIWSAFWLLGANFDQVGWPACGEVDVMENISQESALVHGTVHGPGYFTGEYSLSSGRFADDFHGFALEWDADHLYFSVDGNNYATLDRTLLKNQREWVYNHPFYIILNLPVGGVWPGSPNASTTFPQKMLIDYVRVSTKQ